MSYYQLKVTNKPTKRTLLLHYDNLDDMKNSYNDFNQSENYHVEDIKLFKEITLNNFKEYNIKEKFEMLNK